MAGLHELEFAVGDRHGKHEAVAPALAAAPTLRVALSPVAAGAEADNAAEVRP
ncbi:MAG: hypothetical protein ABI880_04080 [Acidobacteriota bacterium]